MQLTDTIFFVSEGWQQYSNQIADLFKEICETGILLNILCNGRRLSR